LLQSQIYVGVVEALWKKERQDETQFTIKIAKKTSLKSQLIHFVKFSFPIMYLIPYYAKTDHSDPLIVKLYGKLSCNSYPRGICTWDRVYYALTSHKLN
jgi:hypothetical protein